VVNILDASIVLLRFVCYDGISCGMYCLLCQLKLVSSQEVSRWKDLTANVILQLFACVFIFSIFICATKKCPMKNEPSRKQMNKMN
jgi:hypothetical protein